MAIFNKKLAFFTLPVALSALVIGCSTSNTATKAVTKQLLNLERSKANLELKTFELESGDTLVYAESRPKKGRASGEPLLLIHGFGGNMFNFIRIAKEFEDYHVIIPDLLGFGESDKPIDADYRADAQAKRLHELMQAKGLTSNLHIGGNSMGGAITVAYAAMYPNEMGSVWLIDSAGFWTVRPPDSLMNLTVENNPLLVSSYADLDNLLKLTTHKTIYIPPFIMAVMAQKRKDNRPLETKIIGQIVKDNVETQAEVIAKHNIPTLVVWGDKDAIIKPETAPYIKTLIPQAKVIIMPNVGHIPVLEEVKQSANDYKSFRANIKQK